MARQGRHIVTGAFGFLGRHIAQRLLEQGQQVATLIGRAGWDLAGPRGPQGGVERTPRVSDTPGSQALLKAGEARHSTASGPDDGLAGADGGCLRTMLGVNELAEVPSPAQCQG